jgi:glutamate 5-kinase
VKRLAVVKVGTSSLASASGAIDDTALGKLCDDVAAARIDGWQIVLVASGAVAAGLPALGFDRRPTDMGVLQAVAAVGQPRLVARIGARLEQHRIVTGQVLLTPYDFAQRSQYLHARQTFEQLLELGVLPVVNENDTIADDEIRYGDNDLLAALVANMLQAETLALLTDTRGLFTTDPRIDERASLVEEIVEFDALEAVAGGSRSAHGSGGMASKLAAAKMAAWSGVRAVIASATEPDVVRGALAARAGVGTVVQAREVRLSARKLWIAFAQPARGRVVVDAGARKALLHDGRSLLAAGVRAVEGSFEVDAPVEVIGPDSEVFAKGLARYSGEGLRAVAGLRTSALPDGSPNEVIHRDDLVLLP